jgi:CRP/FNR family transcriptional regulator
MDPAMKHHGHTFPVFGPLGVPFSSNRLTDLAEPCSFPRGHNLLQQGMEPETVYLIDSGIVKHVATHPSGRETIAGLRTRGWMEGAVAVLSKTQMHYTCVTVTETVAYPIAKTDFEYLHSQNAVFAKQLGLLLAAELHTVMEAASAVRETSAADRLQQFLEECARCANELPPQDPFSCLKQHEIAQILSITPEHLCRLLGRLKPSCGQACDR